MPVACTLHISWFAFYFFRELQRIVPDVLVVSSGVWHLFRGKNLIEMREEALELKSVMPRLRNTVSP